MATRMTSPSARMRARSRSAIMAARSLPPSSFASAGAPKKASISRFSARASSLARPARHPRQAVPADRPEPAGADDRRWAQPYQFISVYDCASAAEAAWRAGVPNRAYNLGSDSPPPVRQAARRSDPRGGQQIPASAHAAPLVKLALGTLDRLNMPLMDRSSISSPTRPASSTPPPPAATLAGPPSTMTATLLRAAYREYRAGLAAPRRAPCHARCLTLRGNRTMSAKPAISHNDNAAAAARPALLSLEEAGRIDLGELRKSPSPISTRPGAFHAPARLRQGADRARRRRALYRCEGAQDPRFLRRVRCGRLRP